MAQQLQVTKAKTASTSHKQSVKLMKVLLRASVSLITYSRRLFPEEFYQPHKLHGLLVHNLSPNDEESSRILKLLEEGCYPAIDDKHLDKFVFEVYIVPENAIERADCKLLEAYEISFRYDLKVIKVEKIGEGQSNLCTTQTSERADILLRNLISFTDNADPVMCTRFFGLKLFYNDSTPEKDYCPDSFNAQIDDDASSETFSLLEHDLGALSTPFHELKLKALQRDESVEEYAEFLRPRVTLDPKAAVISSEPICPLNAALESPSKPITSFETVKDFVIKNRVSSMKGVMEEFKDVSLDTAREHLNRLVEEGILSLRKNHSFFFRSIETSSEPKSHDISPVQEKRSSIRLLAKRFIESSQPSPEAVHKRKRKKRSKRNVAPIRSVVKKCSILAVPIPIG